MLLPGVNGPRAEKSKGLCFSSKGLSGAKLAHFRFISGQHYINRILFLEMNRSRADKSNGLCLGSNGPSGVKLTLLPVNFR